jgi:hypothetical protein
MTSGVRWTSVDVNLRCLLSHSVSSSSQRTIHDDMEREAPTAATRLTTLSVRGGRRGIFRFDRFSAI